MKINDFLKKIALDIETTDAKLEKDDFYYILKYLGVKKDSSMANDIETFYQDFLISLNNSLVKYEVRHLSSGENKTNYIAFYTDKKANYLNAIKVYFPVKYEYLISALKTIFLYIIRNNISATIKFHLKATNEGIVIRFYDKSDALPFINYCNNNFVLKDLLVKCNPFIATLYGIGCIKDDNTKTTFNQVLSELLSDYFKMKKVNNNLNQVSDIDFLDFVQNAQNRVDDDILKYDIKKIEDSIMHILNSTSPIE